MISKQVLILALLVLGGCIIPIRVCDRDFLEDCMRHGGRPYYCKQNAELLGYCKEVEK